MPLFLKGKTGSQHALKFSEGQWNFPTGHRKLQSEHPDWWYSSTVCLPGMLKVIGFPSSSKINWLISNHRCPFVYLMPWAYLKGEYSATGL